MNQKQEALFITGLLNEKKTQDVLCCDVTSLSSCASYIIICSCSSTTACRAVAGYLEEKTKNKINLLRTDGIRVGEWVVLDFGSVIVHIFINELRQFFNLEKLYNAEKTKIN